MDLNQILNDTDALMGLGYASAEKQEGLLGAIMQLPKPQRAVAVQKLLSKRNIVPGGSLTSRDKAEMRIGALPENIRKGLANKELQLADSLYYTVKSVSGASSIRMLQGNDDLGQAEGNIASQKLEKDAWFLCTHIGILSGNDVAPANAAFGVAVKAILNGTFEFKANGKYLMPKDTSAQIFDTTNRNNVNRGIVELDSPKWIEPQIAINMDLIFSQAAPVNENVKFIMLGQTVLPY
ncbi:MAG TPA: hypothetical protein VGC65_00205 [Bacteroidia bacterium]|jgi:hypothetical protein